MTQERAMKWPILVIPPPGSPSPQRPRIHDNRTTLTRNRHCRNHPFEYEFSLGMAKVYATVYPTGFATSADGSKDPSLGIILDHKALQNSYGLTVKSKRPLAAPPNTQDRKDRKSIAETTAHSAQMESPKFIKMLEFRQPSENLSEVG